MILEPIAFASDRQDGPESVDGFVSQDAPGLALERWAVTTHEWFSVTHLSTGLALNISDFSLPRIARYLPRLAALLDWSAVKGAGDVPEAAQVAVRALRAESVMEQEDDIYGWALEATRQAVGAQV